jgi:hypothetical protein
VSKLSRGIIFPLFHFSGYFFLNNTLLTVIILKKFFIS